MAHDIDPKRLARGTRVERGEHPWASEKTAEKIARDHLREHPRAYPARRVK